jgi:hypothetical protein
MFKLLIRVLLLTGLTGSPALALDKTENDYMVMYKTTTHSFVDIKENLDLAITGLGYKIDNHAFIGRMLDRTAESGAKKVYENAQQYRFCPSSYSRRMLGADPHNIAFCPYVINFYNLPDDPKTIYIMFRKPLIVGSDESKAALRSVDKLLRDIIEEALSF